MVPAHGQISTPWPWLPRVRRDALGVGRSSQAGRYYVQDTVQQEKTIRHAGHKSVIEASP